MSEPNLIFNHYAKHQKGDDDEQTTQLEPPSPAGEEGKEASAGGTEIRSPGPDA